MRRGCRCTSALDASCVVRYRTTGDEKREATPDVDVLFSFLSMIFLEYSAGDFLMNNGLHK